MIKLYPHQEIAKAKVIDRLREFKCVYLMAQERFGKTHTILSALQDLDCKNVLFVTVKNAIKGIQNDYTGNYNFNLQIINYESVLKFKGSYDAIVLDESSKISSFPKMSLNYKNVKDVFKSSGAKYCVWVNATPHIESYSQIYHQLQVVNFWSEKTFYQWHKNYGIPAQVRAGGGLLVNDYSQTQNDKVEAKVKHIFVTGTREDANFAQHESIVEEHIVPMPEETQKIYNTLKKDKVWGEVIADLPAKEMTKLQQLTGGFVYDEDGNAIQVPCLKAKYIKEHSEGNKIAVYAKYTWEVDMLRKYLGASGDAYEFKYNHSRYFVSQIKSGAKGIDLSFCSQHWFYSLDFSGEVFTQAIARMHNKKRIDPVIAKVVTTNLIDKDVLKAVKNKDSFNTEIYRRRNG